MRDPTWYFSVLILVEADVNDFFFDLKNFQDAVRFA
jgi:hypothetical protein